MSANDSLPNDVETLKAMLIAAQAACLEAQAKARNAEADALARALLIEQMKFTIAKVRHERFGQSSERGAVLEAVERIDALFAIEREINGAAPQERIRVRNERSRSLVGALETWLRERRAKLSGKSETAKAIDYSLKRWSAFIRFLDDGRLSMSNNAAERAVRCIAVGRKNWTIGSDEGGRRAAAIYTLIETEGDWQIEAHCPGAEIQCIKGFKSKAEIDEWLQGSRRIDWLRSQGYAK
jgi:hypothetical protein